MSHIDMATGDLVADEGDGPDVSAYSPSPEIMGDTGGDMPDPSYLAQVLGSRNPEERASGMAGLNYTPSQADPNFHPFVQNLMTANEVQPQVDRMDAFRQMVNQQFPRQPDAVRQKTPPLAYILGGLQDALALGSMLRHPTKRQFYTGRHGRGGKPVMQTYYEQPQRVPTQIGGTATALFAPMIQQRQDQRVVDRQNFMRDQQIAAETARYAGSMAMRPPAPPKPPAPSPVLTTYNTLKGIDPKLARLWLENYAAGNKAGAKQTIDDRIVAADASGDTVTKAHLIELKKQMSAAGRAPTTPAGDKTKQQLDVFKGKIKILTDSGLISPDRGRTVAAVAKPYDEQIAALVKQKEMFLKQAHDEGMMGDKALTLAHANATQRQIDALREKKRVAVQGYLTSSGLDLNRPEVQDLLRDEPMVEGVEGMDGEQASGDLGAATPAVPPGFDMQFSDGSHFSEWTEADWAKLRAHSPETYDQLVGEISASGEGQ